MNGISFTIKINGMSIIFTIMFITFMILMGTHRVWETFYRGGRIKGTIVKKWTLNALTVVHVSIGVGCVIEYFVVRREISLFITFLGAAMFFFALIGRTWAINTLGRYHSPHIEVRENQPLITIGPYRYLRHPIYFFTMFELTGFPLIPNAYYSFAIALFIYIPLLLLRLHYEEQLMNVKFAEDYKSYKKEVRALFPLRKKV